MTPSFSSLLLITVWRIAYRYSILIGPFLKLKELLHFFTISSMEGCGKTCFLVKNNLWFILKYSNIQKYSGTHLIQHTKWPGKYVGLYRMWENSGFILVNRNAFGPYIFVGCHWMSDCTKSTVYPITIISYFNTIRFYCILSGLVYFQVF